MLTNWKHISFFLWRGPPPCPPPPTVDHDLLTLEVSRSQTTTPHSRLDSSERMNSSSQRPPPDDTRQSTEKDIHVLAGFEPAIPASERLQTYALDCAATGRLKLKELSEFTFEKQLGNGAGVQCA
jgi:hypothetical protein